MQFTVTSLMNTFHLLPLIVCFLPWTPRTGFTGSLSAVPGAWKEEKLWLLNVGCRASDAKGRAAKLFCRSRNEGVIPIGKMSYVYVKFLYSNCLLETIL